MKSGLVGRIDEMLNLPNNTMGGLYDVVIQNIRNAAYIKAKVHFLYQPSAEGDTEVLEEGPVNEERASSANKRDVKPT